MIAQTHAQSSTSNVPPATEPSAPVAHPPDKIRDGHSATKKRHRQPDADTVGSAATSQRTGATTADADHDVPDGAPARKKKKKKDSVIRK